MFVSKVKYILKYERHKNGFVFIVQDHGWTRPNGSVEYFFLQKLFTSCRAREDETGKINSVNVKCTEQSNKFFVQT